jgi:hypothetical protein
MKTMHCYFNFLFKLGQYYLSPAAQPAPRVHSSNVYRGGAAVQNIGGFVCNLGESGWHLPQFPDINRGQCQFTGGMTIPHGKR